MLVFAKRKRRERKKRDLGQAFNEEFEGNSLASKIRQDKNILGIKIYNYEFKISQFADDTSLLCKDLKSVENVISLLNDFGAVSGLRLNRSKTKALWLGLWRFSDSKPLGLKWTKDPVRTLAIFISYDERRNYEKNITQKNRET